MILKIKTYILFFMREIKCTSLTGQFIWSFRFHLSHSVTNVKKNPKLMFYSSVLPNAAPFFIHFLACSLSCFFSPVSSLRRLKPSYNKSEHWTQHSSGYAK